MASGCQLCVYECVLCCVSKCVSGCLDVVNVLWSCPTWPETECTPTKAFGNIYNVQNWTLLKLMSQRRDLSVSLGTMGTTVRHKVSRAPDRSFKQCISLEIICLPACALLCPSSSLAQQRLPDSNFLKFLETLWKSFWTFLKCTRVTYCSLMPLVECLFYKEGQGKVSVCVTNGDMLHCAALRSGQSPQWMYNHRDRRILRGKNVTRQVCYVIIHSKDYYFLPQRRGEIKTIACENGRQKMRCA